MQIVGTRTIERTYQTDNNQLKWHNNSKPQHSKGITKSEQ